MFEHRLAGGPHSSRGVAVSASVTTHIILGILTVWISTLPHSFVAEESPGPARKYELIWIPAAGPGGGGGGGGNRTPVAASAQRPGRDRLTVPTRAAIAPALKPFPSIPVNLASIPAQPMAAAAQTAAGIIEPSPLVVTMQGPGTEGGAGTGTGTGIGEGQGPGLGPGSLGDTGGGPSGGGVTSPKLLREVKPNYTADAMRAKMQGVVLLECVVLPDGSVGDVRIVKSLDRTFGLDEEAIKAAKQWRFVPGKRFDEPVPVLVTIEVAFTLR